MSQSLLVPSLPILDIALALQAHCHHHRNHAADPRRRRPSVIRVPDSTTSRVSMTLPSTLDSVNSVEKTA
ncbi:MAG TPA: hypothetical protein VN678_04115, partial [Acidobacteriaceae bacterium]|nr:hypothetical protein [Acidobacteriaceae bacterium]